MEYQVTMPFRGVSADERRLGRRHRLVVAAYEIAGTEGAAALGVGRVSLAAGLTKRYFYESFATLAALQSAVVDHAITVMLTRVDPFLPQRVGAPPGPGSPRSSVPSWTTRASPACCSPRHTVAR